LPKFNAHRAPGERFRTRHSAGVHAKNGTLRSTRTLSLLASFAGNPCIGRSIETAKRIDKRRSVS
jgi:hypothetical protein